MSRRRAIVAAMLVALWLPVPVQAACRMTPIEDYNPTGLEGCTVYGEGIASFWSGPGIARNDCLWPWDACTPITITSLETGRSITVTPTMFCDCYTGTPDQRLVDLDPEAVRALGLDPSRGLFPVRVEPVEVVGHDASPALPDTAMR